jgi:molybdopterin-guanine dinucleotide biosynthesis protein A
MFKTTGLVLAGGRSSRMGTDKAMLCIQSARPAAIATETMLQRAVNQLSNLALDSVYVSGAKHGGLVDQFEQLGPAAGVISCINNLGLSTGDNLLVVPVDMPQIPHVVLQRLLDYSIKNKRSAYTEQHLFPLILRIDTLIVKALKVALMQRQTLSIRQLLATFKAAPITFYGQENSLLSINLNTPKDWRNFIKAS